MVGLGAAKSFQTTPVVVHKNRSGVNARSGCLDRIVGWRFQGDLTRFRRGFSSRLARGGGLGKAVRRPLRSPYPGARQTGAYARDRDK